MQTSVKIPTKDHKSIYGVLDTQDTNTKKIIIFVHGFTGSMNEQQYFNAVPFFNNKGYSTFRFDLYRKAPDARKTSEVSFQNHIQDTESVINYFSTKFEKIYLIGYSLGGTVVSLIDKKHIEKIVLWDPTNGFNSPKEKGFLWNEDLNLYICRYRMDILFGRELIEEWQDITIQQQISSLTVPTKIIFAGNYTKYDEWKDYLDDTKKFPFSYHIIPGASHTFIEPGIAEQLYEETHKWIG